MQTAWHDYPDCAVVLLSCAVSRCLLNLDLLPLAAPFKPTRTLGFIVRVLNLLSCRLQVVNLRIGYLGNLRDTWSCALTVRILWIEVNLHDHTRVFGLHKDLKVWI